MSPTVQLRPMTDDEYATWRARSVPAYAHDMARALRICEDLAAERAHAQYEQMLPDGSASADNHLLVVVGEDEASVGSLWLRFSPGTPDAFVAEILIDEQVRGRGYGRATMLAAEQFVGGLGATGLALHVFADNVGAIHLYEDMGYTTTSQNMRKDITQVF